MTPFHVYGSAEREGAATLARLMRRNWRLIAERRRTNEYAENPASARPEPPGNLLFAIATMVVGFLLVAAVRNAPQVLAVAGVGDRREDLIQVVHELEACRVN